MTNNLGRTEVSVNQTQKEDTLNNSDARIDAAITDTITYTWSGAINAQYWVLAREGSDCAITSRVQHMQRTA